MPNGCLSECFLHIHECFLALSLMEFPANSVKRYNTRHNKNSGGFDPAQSDIVFGRNFVDIMKVGMTQCLFGVDAMLWIAREHGSQQIQAFCAQLGNYIAQLFLFPLWKLQLEVRKVKGIGPRFLAWRTERLKHLKEYFYIGKPGEKGPSRRHLCKNATGAP